MDIQSNLVNSKSSGLEVLLQIISSSNYREVDIKYITPKLIIITYDNFTLNSIFWPKTFIKKKHALKYQLHNLCSTIILEKSPWPKY